jgi:hypothetical protein
VRSEEKRIVETAARGLLAARLSAMLREEGSPVGTDTDVVQLTGSIAAVCSVVTEPV